MTPAKTRTGSKTRRGTAARKTSGKGSAKKKTSPRGGTRPSGKGSGKTSGGSAAATGSPGTARKTGASRSSAKPASGGKPSGRAKRLPPKQRFAEILARLDRVFGELVLPETSRDTLERAVFLVLREQGTASSTKKALAVLREEYVDWNEVRVSRSSELARMMLGTGRASSLRRVYPRAQRMRDMIDQIYNERNETSLDFLLEMKPKDQLEFLEDLDDLGIHNAYALVQWLSGDDKLVLVSPELARAAQALGLTDSAAVTKVRKELGDLCEPGDLVRVQAHLNQLAEREDNWPQSLQEFKA